MIKYKTVIIGAGPGGLRCAKVLAENDEDFILLEQKQKFERKVCTGMWGITEKTRYMGLPDDIFEKKFNKLVISTPNDKKEIKSEKPCVATLNRKSLSLWMMKQAKKAGANIQMGSLVSEINKEFVICGGVKIYFNNLVGSDGSNSIVRKSIGLPTGTGLGMQYWTKQKFDNMEIHLSPDLFGQWYGWIAPHSKLTSIGTGGDPKIVSAKKMKENLDMWCKQNDFEVSNSTFESAPINYDYKGFKFGNKFLTGDAAGFTSGLTGEGIYFAMASGEDVAKMIINSKHKPALIEQVLSIKRKHELIASLFNTNKRIQKIEQRILLLMFSSKFFCGKAIGLVA
ncbi:NAD(P)/FAD-dependent oxidoreductase [Candidatus Woesearchaeota archaeon]|nr:NAD(P)/FAD-dependent oxidoreductase [Candidatus Woesearchaeota archaeon]